MKKKTEPFDHQGKRRDQVEFSVNAASILVVLLLIVILIAIFTRP